MWRPESSEAFRGRLTRNDVRRKDRSRRECDAVGERLLRGFENILIGDERSIGVKIR